MDITSKKFYDLIQKTCLPGVWSKGVSLARTDGIVREASSPEEVIFRVKSADHPVSRKVTLWPQDEDWYCDCNDRNDVCPHVAATVIFLKSGKPDERPEKTAAAHSALIEYRFRRLNVKLLLERRISQGKEKSELFTGTLTSYIGGVSTGRIQAPSLIATKDDFSVDQLLSHFGRAELDRFKWIQLFKVLSNCSNLFLDDQPIQVSSKPLQPTLQIRDENRGFRLKIVQNNNVTEVFSNGAVLCGSTLCGLEIPSLTSQERELVAENGKYFPPEEFHFLVSELIPSLEKKIPVDLQTQKLPTVKEAIPKIILHTEVEPSTGSLIVSPRLEYEETSTQENVILKADPVIEKNLVRKLQHDLQLIPGQVAKFSGDSAIEFTQKIKNWETRGKGILEFALHGILTPDLYMGDSQTQLSFKTADKNARGADATQVFSAWRNNQNYVRLLNGGWGILPKDWLFRYGDRISSILAAKNDRNEIPKYLIPELIEACPDSDLSNSSHIQTFMAYLNKIDRLPEAILPTDLNVSLRPYQRLGINWLNFMKEAGMGAMLADDMGLGKTLQTLCVVHGRTLIVTPTSVLKSWASQIENFRPQTSYSIYYGNNRKLDQKSKIIITSYALLRLDKDLLTAENWDTIVLDEAQTIKNPDSQVAKVAHSLQGTTRIALSGTPIENKLEDLWSQFRFLNPGLLGDRSSFGDQSLNQVRKAVKPFILRRLKKEVATELPPRTEVVLHCELSQEEREVYDSVLAAAKTEVLEKLEAGGSVFSALELLLRLRQACCHVSLIPGQTSSFSSKIELLVQTLENSISLGHKSLIFSQWTSYLDLIEPELKKAGISLVRLDGTTRDRHSVVETFQNDSSIKVMLISLKAGGIGLTLTAADHVFLMDPWWNPAVEDQAADRAHRIGQTNPVIIHRMVAQGTIEDKILILQQNKTQLAKSILQDSTQTAHLTRDDLLMLLS